MKPSKPKPISTLTSKWTKTKILLKSKNLSSYIPETRLFNYSTLLMMLKKFKMVYVKPIHGSFGRGVMRVEWKEYNGGEK